MNGGGLGPPPVEDELVVVVLLVVVTGVLVVVLAVVVVVVIGASAPTCRYTPSVDAAELVVNEIDENVPDSCTVPFASSVGFSTAPTTSLPETLNWASPLTPVITVPDGKCRVEPSDAKSSTGLTTAGVKLSV